jgi:hypothetical protein
VWLRRFPVVVAMQAKDKRLAFNVTGFAEIALKIVYSVKKVCYTVAM